MFWRERIREKLLHIGHLDLEIFHLEDDPAPVDGVGRVEGDPEFVEESVARRLPGHERLDEVLADVKVTADADD